ncbi:MAG: ABC transporter permease [Acidobacteriia bacterium]|nr:ABC transporter permease [Terriglobia bacterium]
MPRIRYAFRSLAKAPLLSLVVILSLGLGIGANTAIFSVMHQMVLASLPVEKPEEIALLSTPGTPKSGSLSTDASGDAEYVFSYPAFRELEKQRQGVTGMAAFKNTGASIGYGKQAFTGAVMLVSGGYFGVLGVRPVVGRPLTPADDQAGGGNPVAVLSYNYWNDRLAGEPVLNQPLRVNGRVFTIVGIAPKNFNGTTLGQEPSVFIPLATKSFITPDWKGATRHNDYFLYVLARLKPGVTREQAAAALSGTYASLVEEQVNIPNNYDQKAAERLRKSRLRLVDGSHGNSFVRRESKTPLIILMIATGMVLLIAMANAANLLLARSAERRKELAIRAAIGAGAGGVRRLRGRLPRLRDSPADYEPVGGRRSASSFSRYGHSVAGAAVRAGPVAADRHIFRTLSRVGSGAQFAGGNAQPGIRPRVVRARDGARPPRPGLRAGDHFRRAADPHRTVHEKPGESAARGCGDADGQCGDLPGSADVERVYSRAEPCVVRAG